MHTRSTASVRRSVAARASTAESCLGSMLTRMSGQVVSRSSSSGIGSMPSTRAWLTSAQVCSRISPVRSVTRSRRSSWKAHSTPSVVTCTSVST